VAEVERSAASVEEAIEAALEELGVSEQEAVVEIVQEPQRGLLGLGSRDAVVRVRVRGEAVDQVELEEQAEVGAAFLGGVLERMGLEAGVEPHLVDGVMYLDVVAEGDPEEMGRLIGRHGQTLEALQEVVRGAIQRSISSRPRIVVDVEDYRKRRRAQLVERAKEAGEKVKRTGDRHRMEPMNAFERKIVHDAVAEIPGVESASEGEDPQRRVVIRRRGR
jgi:spoIIIJ-associated protein